MPLDPSTLAQRAAVRAALAAQSARACGEEPPPHRRTGLVQDAAPDRPQVSRAAVLAAFRKGHARRASAPEREEARAGEPPRPSREQVKAAFRAGHRQGAAELSARRAALASAIAADLKRREDW